MRHWMHVRSKMTAVVCAAFLCPAFLSPWVCFAEPPQNLITDSQLVTFEVVRFKFDLTNARRIGSTQCG